jgi:SEC-C motif-containing protein
MPIPAQLGGTGTDGNGAAQDRITPVKGGHVHSDGTFHADKPGNGSGPSAGQPVAAGAAGAATAAAGAAAGVAIKGLKDTQRKALQYSSGNADQVAEAGAARGTKPKTADPGHNLGRNDPCWCGSGKKYKRCHGA